jgi:GNAT superfamily N-acetyltransferase
MRISTSPEGFSDWPGLVNLVRDAFAYMDSRIDPPSSLTRMGLEEFKAKAEKEVLIVAYERLTLVGCAFADLREDCVYLGKVAVTKAARGKGVARRLFAAADELAKSHGKQALELQTRVELVENHATFGALGFIKVAETAHPGYSRSTSNTMRRPVERSAA